MCVKQVVRAPFAVIEVIDIWLISVTDFISFLIVSIFLMSFYLLRPEEYRGLIYEVFIKIT